MKTTIGGRAMSITDELRKYAQDWRENPNLMDDLDAGDIDGLLGDFEHIADRIDAEHDKTLNSVDGAYDSGYNVGYDEGFASADDWLSQHEDDMAEHGWVRLPLDVDNVPIHVGDMMKYADKPTEPLTVSYIELEENGWWVFAGGMGRRPDKYRHHHAPTVEDVLRDVVTLCHNTWKEGSAFEFYDVDDVMKSGNIADFAAKLRLAGDDE